MNDSPELQLRAALEQVLALDEGARDDVLRRLQAWIDAAIVVDDEPDAKRYPLH